MTVKLLLWVLLGFAVAGLGFLLVVVSGGNPVAAFLYAAVVGAGVLGAFWMMLQAIRYEKHPLPMLLLAFLPYAFLWYYFERVRSQRRQPYSDISVATRLDFRETGKMPVAIKLVLLIVIPSIVMGIAIWTILSVGLPRSVLLWFIGLFVFVVPPLGAFWMIYVAVRYEANPWPTAFLAVMPYSFLWYYLERVRAKRLRSRRTS